MRNVSFNLVSLTHAPLSLISRLSRFGLSFLPAWLRGDQTRSTPSSTQGSQKTNAAASRSMLHWIFASAYWGGCLFEVLSIYLLTLSYSIIYFAVAKAYALWYTALGEDSFAAIVAASLSVVLIHVAFSMVETLINSLIKQVAQKQIQQTRHALLDFMQDKIKRMDQVENQSEALVKSTEDFFTLAHDFHTTLICKLTGAAAHAAYVIRFPSLWLILLQTTGLSIILNIIVRQLTTSDNTYSTKHLNKLSSNNNDDLRNSVAEIQENRPIYAGDRSSRAWVFNRLHNTLDTINQVTSRSIIIKSCLDFVKACITRVYMPLSAILISRHLGLRFPLADHVKNNSMVDYGVFVQLTSALSSIWRDSLVFVDKHDSFSKADAGYNILQKLCNTYGFTPLDLGRRNTSKAPSFLVSHLRQICLTTTLLLILQRYSPMALASFAPLSGPYAVICTTHILKLAVLSLMITMITPALFKQKSAPSVTSHFDLNIFASLSTYFLLATFSFCAYFVPLLSYLTTHYALATAAICALLPHCILHASLHNVARLVSHIDRQRILGSSCMGRNDTLLTPSTDNKLDITDMELSSLSSTSMQSSSTLVWRLDDSLSFSFKQAHLIMGPNSTGKSTLLKGLSPDNHASLERFTSQATSPKPVRIVYLPQTGNTTGQLPSKNESFDLCYSGQTFKMSPLAGLFMRHAISNPTLMNAQDEWICNNWHTIQGWIIEFLEDQNLEFDAGATCGWIADLKQNRITANMSGGAVAKLNAAVFYALIKMYSQCPIDQSKQQDQHEKLLLMIDEGFNDVDVDVRPFIFQKLADATRSSEHCCLICVLHTEVPELIKSFDQVIKLKQCQSEKDAPLIKAGANTFTANEYVRQLPTPAQSI